MSPASQGKGRERAARRAGSPRCGDAGSDTPLFVFTRDQIRALDQAAANELAIPTILLMEHASLGLARHAMDMAPQGAVLVVCGKGNNAGDGLALARHLHVREMPVSVVIAQPEALEGAAGDNLEMVRRLGVPLVSLGGRSASDALREAARALPGVSLIVDAILGTGLVGPPRGPLLELITGVNDRSLIDAPVLAVDIPSGMDADTGEPTGGPAEAVKADRTVTFVGLKKGFLALGAQRLLGDVCVEGIGTPRSLAARFGEILGEVEPPGESADLPSVTVARPPGRDQSRVRGRG